MPEEIETQLEPQGMADLLSYLQSNIGNERQIFNAWRKDQILGELKKSILARFSYGIFKKFTCISIVILFKSTIPDSCKSKQTGPIMLECSNARKRRELACTFIVLPTWLRSKLR
jgi:hypothetical protein